MVVGDLEKFKVKRMKLEEIIAQSKGKEFKIPLFLHKSAKIDERLDFIENYQDNKKLL
jgi:hypothetical protein